MHLGDGSIKVQILDSSESRWEAAALATPTPTSLSQGSPGIHDTSGISPSSRSVTCAAARQTPSPDPIRRPRPTAEPIPSDASRRRSWSQRLDVTGWDPGQPRRPSGGALADTDVAAHGTDRLEHERFDGSAVGACRDQHRARWIEGRLVAELTAVDDELSNSPVSGVAPCCPHWHERLTTRAHAPSETGPLSRTPVPIGIPPGMSTAHVTDTFQPAPIRHELAVSSPPPGAPSW